MLLGSYVFQSPAQSFNFNSTTQDQKMNLCFSLVCCGFLLVFATSVKTDVIRSVIPAERLCLPGPPLKRTPGKINCLVIGDSISIGYAIFCFLFD